MRKGAEVSSVVPSPSGLPVPPCATMAGTRNRQRPKASPLEDNAIQPVHDAAHCRRAREHRSRWCVCDNNKSLCCAQPEKYDQKSASLLGGYYPRCLDLRARCSLEANPERQACLHGQPWRRENVEIEEPGAH